MSLDEAKVEDELLTKVLREPFEYNTPTLNSPSVETESQTSHYHPQFSEKDYLSEYKMVFGHVCVVFAPELAKDNANNIEKI